MTTDNTSEALVSIEPLDQRTIEFYDDEVVAVLVESENGEGEIYVPLRPICDVLGLDWSAQLKRVKRDPVLREGQRMVIMTTHRRGEQAAICLPLDLLHGWLFGVNPGKVNPEHRKKVDLYRRDCYKILSRAFQADAVTPVGRKPAGDTIAALAQIRATALAVAELAEQQIELEQRVSAHDFRLDKASEVVKDLRVRLKAVEKQLAPPAFVSVEQAAQISNEVKGLAEYLSSKDNSKNHYASVFGAIYRSFETSSYKRIRKGQFEAVMRFLADWRKSVDATGKLLPPG